MVMTLRARPPLHPVSPSPSLPVSYFVLSIGSPWLFQAFMPPSSAAAFSMPFDLSVSTAPALVCSLGQVQ